MKRGNLAAMRVGMLAYGGCFATELFGVADVLLIANRVAAARRAGNGDSDDEPFRVSVLAARPGEVEAAGGFPVRADSVVDDIDVLIVPGCVLDPRAELGPRLAAWRRETATIRQVHAAGVPVASVCVGAFLLGEAGLLDGRRATTSWLFADELGRRYPATSVDAAAILVDDDRVITTAAFTAALDLATYLVRREAGPEVARATARITLAADNRTDQSRYVDETLLFASGRGTFAADVQRWLREHLRDPYDLGRLAAAFNVSTRTMLRRFRAETGKTPLASLQAARIAAAKRILERTDAPVAQVVEQVGYGDVATFRRLFARHVGVTASSYRRQFRRPADP